MTPESEADEAVMNSRRWNDALAIAAILVLGTVLCLSLLALVLNPTGEVARHIQSPHHEATR
jgi:hypothetical protein